MSYFLPLHPFHPCPVRLWSLRISLRPVAPMVDAVLAVVLIVDADADAVYLVVLIVDADAVYPVVRIVDAVYAAVVKSSAEENR